MEPQRRKRDAELPSQKRQPIAHSAAGRTAEHQIITGRLHLARAKLFAGNGFREHDLGAWKYCLPSVSNRECPRPACPSADRLALESPQLGAESLELRAGVELTI